jgi:hypothetical protein
MCVTCDHHTPGGPSGEDVTAVIGALAIAGLAAVTYKVMTVIWPLYLACLLALGTWVYVVAPARRAARKRRRHTEPVDGAVDSAVDGANGQAPEHDVDGSADVDGWPGVDRHAAPAIAPAVDATPDRWLGPADIDRAIERGRTRDAYLNGPHRLQLDRTESQR